MGPFAAMAQVSKHFSDARFEAAVVREAYDLFRTLVPNRGPRDHQIAAIDDHGTRWRLDESNQFFAAYHPEVASAELSVEYGQHAFRFRVRDRGVDVEVSMVNSDSIGLILSVFEDASEDATGRSRIFLGHGRDGAWHELRTRLDANDGYTVLTYEGAARPGITAIELLYELRSKSDFAVLVHTCDRQFGDGHRIASENVIHETGFFQGALGRERTLVVREQGCPSFDNILGLHEVLFARGEIAAAFAEVENQIARALGFARPA